MKFERHFDAEIIDFQVNSSKLKIQVKLKVFFFVVRHSSNSSLNHRQEGRKFKSIMLIAEKQTRPVELFQQPKLSTHTLCTDVQRLCVVIVAAGCKSSFIHSNLSFG